MWTLMIRKKDNIRVRMCMGGYGVERLYDVGEGNTEKYVNIASRRIEDQSFYISTCRHLETPYEQFVNFLEVARRSRSFHSQLRRARPQ